MTATRGRDWWPTATGAPGIPVTIAGVNFRGATAVTFGGISASFTVNSDTLITATLPGAPLLVVLRDPVRRAISNYRFSTQNGVDDLPISEALRAEAGERSWDHAR